MIVWVGVRVLGSFFLSLHPSCTGRHLRCNILPLHLATPTIPRQLTHSHFTRIIQNTTFSLFIPVPSGLLGHRKDRLAIPINERFYHLSLGPGLIFPFPPFVWNLKRLLGVDLFLFLDFQRFFIFNTILDLSFSVFLVVCVPLLVQEDQRFFV